MLFRATWNEPGPLGAALAQNQYAAYECHPAIVTGVQAALLGAALPPLLKFAVVTLASVPLVFLFGAWMRQARFVRAGARRPPCH